MTSQTALTDQPLSEPALPPGYTLIAFDTVGSTNDEAKRLATSGALQGTVVWAREQTAGRGRQARHWASPRGNLFVSFILRPSSTSAAAATLGFVAALSVADVVRDMCPNASVRLKWPNDVLIDGPLLQPPPSRGGGFLHSSLSVGSFVHSPSPLEGGGREEGVSQGAKVSGILLESSIAQSGHLEWLVAGIGINLIAAPQDTPYKAAALADFGPAPSLERALMALVKAFDRWLSIWSEDGFEPIRAAWLDQGTPSGTPIAVKEGSVVSEGVFLDLDQDGALVFEAATGVRRITAADVYFPLA